MNNTQVISQEASIVLLGNMNPKIFHPHWFVGEGLLRKEEADAAEIPIVSDEFSQFQSGWIRVQVTRDRAAFTTSMESHFELLRDLFLGCFNVLSHTPTKALGINLDRKLRFSEVGAWHRLGNTLVPKDRVWSELLQNPGMRTLTVEGHRKDDHKGFIRVRVESIEDVEGGTFIGYNDHYNLANAEANGTAQAACAIVASNWANSVSEGRRVIQSVLETSQ